MNDDSPSNNESARLRVVEKKVAVIESDNRHTVEYLDRIDQTLSKLTEVSSNLSKILAVQETRLAENEKNADLIRQTVSDIDKEIKGIKDQVTTKSDSETLDSLKKKVNRIEKSMYISWGGITVIVFFIVNFGKHIVNFVMGSN